MGNCKNTAAKREKQQNSDEQTDLQRRQMLGKVMMFGACVAGCPSALAQASSEDLSAEQSEDSIRPKAGDILVHSEGEYEGEPVTCEQVKQADEFVSCWPKDPTSGVVRKGSRFNKVILRQLDEESLSEKTVAYADAGIVAYSGICTHQGCDISAWVEKYENFFCFCHYSRFDPSKFGKVTYGPAKKRLPMLPIKIVEGNLQVTGEFSRRPG